MKKRTIIRAIIDIIILLMTISLITVANRLYIVSISPKLEAYLYTVFSLGIVYLIYFAYGLRMYDGFKIREKRIHEHLRDNEKVPIEKTN